MFLLSSLFSFYYFSFFFYILIFFIQYHFSLQLLLTRISIRRTGIAAHICRCKANKPREHFAYMFLSQHLYIQVWESLTWNRLSSFIHISYFATFSFVSWDLIPSSLLLLSLFITWTNFLSLIYFKLFIILQSEREITIFI